MIKYKVLIGLLVLSIGFLGIKLFMINRDFDAFRASSTRVIEEANLELGRAQTTIGEAKQTIALLEKNIQEEIRLRNAIVKTYTEAIAKLKTKGTGNITTPTNTVAYDAAGKPIESFPFEFRDFRLHILGDAVTKKLEYTLTQSFELQVAEAESSNGDISTYISLYELDNNQKRVGKLDLTKAEVLRTKEEVKAKLSLWNPQLDIGAGITSNLTSIKPKITTGVTVGSFGKFKSNPDVKILRVGISLDSSQIGLDLSPAMYNIAKKIPLVDNLYITPTVGKEIYPDTNYYLGLGITAGL